MKNKILNNAYVLFTASVHLTSDKHIVTVTDAVDMMAANLRAMEKGAPTGYDIPVDYDTLLPAWRETGSKERAEILTEVKDIFKDKQHELGDAVAAGNKEAFEAILAEYKDVK